MLVLLGFKISTHNPEFTMNKYQQLISDLNNLGVTKTTIADMIGYDRSYLYRNTDNNTVIGRKVDRLLGELSVWREDNYNIVAVTPTSLNYPTYLEHYFTSGTPAVNDLEWGKLMLLLDRHLTMFGVKRFCQQAEINPLFVYRYVPSRAGKYVCFPKPVWSETLQCKAGRIRFAIEHFHGSLNKIFDDYGQSSFDIHGLIQAILHINR